MSYKVMDFYLNRFKVKYKVMDLGDIIIYLNLHRTI